MTNLNLGIDPEKVSAYCYLVDAIERDLVEQLTRMGKSETPEDAEQKIAYVREALKLMEKAPVVFRPLDQL